MVEYCDCDENCPKCGKKKRKVYKENNIWNTSK